MKTALIALAILIVAVGGYFFFSNTTKAPITPAPVAVETTTTPVVTTTPAPEVPTLIEQKPIRQDAAVAQKKVTVMYDGSTFTPNSVTVHVGDTVTFVRSGASPMWVATDSHPAHTGYNDTTKSQHCPDTAGVAFDQCTIGPSYTFTFTKTGSWKYHNHVSTGARGTVVVTQ